MSQVNFNDLHAIIPEKELLELFGLKKSMVAKWRKNGLKYVRLSRTHRFYFVSDVLIYMHEHRICEKELEILENINEQANETERPFRR